MKRLCVAALVYLTMAGVLADMTVYHIFADGLGCVPCASDVDRLLREIEGVDSVDVLSELSVVNVRMAEGYELADAQVKKIFDDADVSFGHIEHHPMGEH